MRMAACLASFLVATSVWALQPGDSVPDVKVASTSGEDVSLNDFEGKWVVLYFYPRSFTGGCTAQSCSLRDDYESVQERGAIVIGASVDPINRQKEFKKEYKLPFELLSDVDKELSRAFDSLMVGGLMSARKTFIINPEGKIAHRFDRPKTVRHAEEVVEQLDRLTQE